MSTPELFLRYFTVILTGVILITVMLLIVGGILYLAEWLWYTIHPIAGAVGGVLAGCVILAAIITAGMREFIERP